MYKIFVFEFSKPLFQMKHVIFTFWAKISFFAENSRYDLYKLPIAREDKNRYMNEIEFSFAIFCANFSKMNFLFFGWQTEIKIDLFHCNDFFYKTLIGPRKAHLKIYKWDQIKGIIKYDLAQDFFFHFHPSTTLL